MYQMSSVIELLCHSYFFCPDNRKNSTQNFLYNILNNKLGNKYEAKLLFLIWFIEIKVFTKCITSNGWP